MNRWHIYEWLKQSYMFSGKVPTREAVIAKFGSVMDREELEEGIAEFSLATKHMVPSMKERTA